MNGRLWAAEDDALLVRMTDEEHLVASIAAALGRTKDATVMRRCKIGAGRKMKWSPAKIERFLAMAESGMSRSELAKAMGLSIQTIANRLLRHGIRRVPKITDARIQQISDMLARGRSRSTIARVLGVNVSYVYYHVRRHGLVGPKTVVNVFEDHAEKDATVRRLAAEGHSHVEIARRIGTSSTNVRSKLMTLAHRDEVIALNGMAAVRYVNRRAA